MHVCTANDGLRVSHRHQHEHQCVVSYTVRRIGDISNGNADALRVLHIDMIITNASCRDILHAGLAECVKCGVCDLSLMTHADASVSECQFNVGLRYRCLSDGWPYAKARRHLSEQNGLVLPASIDCDS